MGVSSRKAPRRSRERLVQNADEVLPEESADGSDDGMDSDSRMRVSPFVAGSAVADMHVQVSECSVAKRIRNGRSKEDLDEIRASPSYKSAAAVVQHLLSDSHAFLFAKPVTELWTIEELPGYFDIIEKPMDLGTVLKNTLSLEYIVERDDGSLDFDDAAFFADLRRVFRNCMAYNDLKSDYYRHARRLLHHADRRFSVRPVHSHSTRRAAVVPGAQISQNLREVVPDLHEEPRAASILSTASKVQNTTDAVIPDPSKSARCKPKEETVVATVGSVVVAAAGSVVTPQTNRKGHSSKAGRPPTMLKLPTIPGPGVPVHSQAEEARASVAAPGPSSGTAKKNSKMPHTASVSSDEPDTVAPELVFTFVSTAGMEKKRGRKSALVQDLESRHEQLLKRRKLLLDSSSTLEQRKQVEMTYEEKNALCDQVALLDFMQMKGVVDIIARGMNRSDILNEEEVDMDIDSIDNKVLREIQAFLENSTVFAAHGTLRHVEEELAEIEAQIVDIRYYKGS